MALIPQSTKDNVPTFWQGRFSNDGTLMLIDGYNENGELTHPSIVLLAWLQWSSEPEAIMQTLLATAIEYSKTQFRALTIDPTSKWFVDMSEDV